MDFFDKRIMEIVKYQLVQAADMDSPSSHESSFKGEVSIKNYIVNHQS